MDVSRISEAERFFAATDRSDPPLWEATLRPHRSLTNRGFAAAILLAAGGLAIPLFAVIGTAVLWGLLPFAVIAVWALWAAIRRSDLDGTLCEHVRLWPDLIAVERINPQGPPQYWHANPYWVEPRLQDTRNIPAYLTLRGAGREIELGSFLTRGEREELYRSLRTQLARAREITR